MEAVHRWEVHASIGWPRANRMGWGRASIAAEYLSTKSIPRRVWLAVPCLLEARDPSGGVVWPRCVLSRNGIDLTLLAERLRAARFGGCAEQGYGSQSHSSLSFDGRPHCCQERAEARDE